MEWKNPREGCAALVLRHYHQRRAGIARIRQTWLPTGRIRQPDEESQRRAWHGAEVWAGFGCGAWRVLRGWCLVARREAG